MTERPILFSAPMVRALLAGTKTQTRRALRGFCPPSTPEFDSETGRLEWFNGDEVVVGIRCPFGQPGDRLWVREAWARTQIAQDATGASVVVYREGDNRTDYGGPWKPSIHMPRAASRITLAVIGIRIERLQAISRGDAMAEGCPFANMAAGPDPRDWYRDLWDQINGDGAWAANPWVWVVEFKRAEVTRG